jgi:DnaJ-class molecular chaperone
MEDNWETRWKGYYKIHQVHPSAEQEVIKAAYDRLARKYHPDLNKDKAADQDVRHLIGIKRRLSKVVRKGGW